MSATPGGDAVRLVMKSDPRYLCLVRAMVRAFGGLSGFDEASTHKIVLAVDEGCTNIIRHAYGGRLDGDIEVSCCLEPHASGREQMVIRLEDRGRPIEASGCLTREREDPLVPGGLGLRFMRELMDGMRFTTQPDGGNTLELRVTCPECRPAPEA